MIINDNDYKEVSATAIVTSYPRIFTDIPYEREIYEWLSTNCTDEVNLNKLLAPEIEARYKLISKLLDQSNIFQVLELAAGYSSRGFIYAQKGYQYVEMDLEKVSYNKKEILHSISPSFPPSLKLVSGNALRKSDYESCRDYFDENEPVAVINEGLLRYLTFDEKRIVAENIYSLLKLQGGIWITSDVTPKKFIQTQDKALPDFNMKLSQVTSRNTLNDRFEDIAHVRKFFGEVGFDVVEVHKFSEMQENLYSMNYYQIYNENIEKSLDDAIVVAMKVKK